MNNHNMELFAIGMNVTRVRIASLKAHISFNRN